MHQDMAKGGVTLNYYCTRNSKLRGTALRRMPAAGLTYAYMPLTGLTHAIGWTDACQKMG